MSYVGKVIGGALLYVVAFVVPVHISHAAILYFDPTEAEVYRGDTISVALRLDVGEGECINTVDAIINYDPSIRAVDISRGDSILNLWVEAPVIDETAHTIRFAGGIPGGYCGRIPGDPRLTNEIVQLVFRSPGFTIGGGENSDKARIWIDEISQVLLHDGQGTVAPLVTQDVRITLMDTPGASPQDSWTQEVRSDDQEPSDFIITLSQDEFAFSGKHFITFNAIDKQSGIDHYEVMEEPFSEFYTFAWGRADAPWVRVESPYVLEDQTLNSTIRVKAVDKAGNERVEVLVPDVAQRSISHDALITIILSVTVFVIILGVVIYLYIRRRNAANDDVDDIQYE